MYKQWTIYQDPITVLCSSTNQTPFYLISAKTPFNFKQANIDDFQAKLSSTAWDFVEIPDINLAGLDEMEEYFTWCYTSTIPLVKWKPGHRQVIPESSSRGKEGLSEGQENKINPTTDSIS